MLLIPGGLSSEGTSPPGPWYWRQYAHLKRRSISTRLHGAISHKTVILSWERKISLVHLSYFRPSKSFSILFPRQNSVCISCLIIQVPCRIYRVLDFDMVTILDGSYLSRKVLITELTPYLIPCRSKHVRERFVFKHKLCCSHNVKLKFRNHTNTWQIVCVTSSSIKETERNDNSFPNE
jgi:hypothetical protein